MKGSLIIAILLLFSFSSSACKSKDKKKVKQTILQIFDLVEAGKSNLVANYIVYRGNDSSRKWKDYCRYDIAEEKHQVQNIHQRIVSRYLPFKYKFVKFTTQKESEGEWLVWQMKFYEENEKPKTVFFAFLKVGDRYLLGDID